MSLDRTGHGSFSPSWAPVQKMGASGDSASSGQPYLGVITARRAPMDFRAIDVALTELEQRNEFSRGADTRRLADRREQRIKLPHISTDPIARVFTKVRSALSVRHPLSLERLGRQSS